MKGSNHFFPVIALFFVSARAFGITVNDSSDPASGAPPAQSLRGALLSAVPGDTISFNFGVPTTINLQGGLPAIVGNLTITNATANAVTIDGQSLYQIFSVAQGIVAIDGNITIQNGLSKGGDGGTGFFFNSSTGAGGGGGGAGGGGGLYIHGGATVTLTNVSLLSNQAQGGNGGVISSSSGGGGGGGGGGFGSNFANPLARQSNNGGLHTSNVTYGGGGGGGNTSGGNGGSYDIFTGSGNTGGIQSYTAGGGGGGGTFESGAASNLTGGGVYGLPLATPILYPGGSGFGFNGGGGAGLGGNGLDGTSSAGGLGGPGIGADQFFGGGGGGGGGSSSGTSGGDGYGTGGGGAASSSNGGNGGILGGGGGGSGKNGNGGNGFLGGGGGGCLLLAQAPGSSAFGGGAGGQGTGSGSSGGTGGGGGGAAMGGNVIIQNLGILEIGTTTTVSGGNVQGGTGGAGLFGGATGANGSAFGLDFFISSGGILRFTNSDTFTVSTNIESNQGQGTPSPVMTGGLIMNGTGILNLAGPGGLVHTYTASTTINSGTVQIDSDANLGSTLSPYTGQVIIQNGILQVITNNVSSSRPFFLQGGSATIQTDVSLVTLNGPITGSGSLTKTGTGNLWLKGTNTYSGGTTVSTNTLLGNTNSLQGTIQIDPLTTLEFLQPANGTFNGVLSGGGTLQIGDGVSSYAEVQIGNVNPSFVGPTNILSGGALRANGSLANSSQVTLSQGGFLGGSGTVGPLTSGGTIQPGNSVGILTVNGALDLTLTSPSSVVIIEVSPSAASLLQVLGPATLDGTLIIAPDPGFYGATTSYTILTSTLPTGLGGTTFTSHHSTDPSFVALVQYTTTDVILNLIHPVFIAFPYANPNEESVGNNLNALFAAGDLTLSSPLGTAIKAFAGLSIAQINEALDQMHPAPFSAFAEIQADLGAELLSFFHRRPGPHCVCSDSPRLWVEPYGDWLQEKSIYYQVGFHARSQGVAAGLDVELLEGWSVGVGGAWNDTHMQWNREQGFSETKNYYAAAYMDYSYKNFYVGLACATGFDHCSSSRHIHYSTVNEHAHGSRHNREWMGQITLAFSSGPSNCFTFPYFTLDYFYLKQGSLKEKGAPGLNLHVSEQSGGTLRAEAGFLLEGQALSEDKVFCLSPLFGVGWAMETPLHRTSYRATFEGMPIPFRVTGWEYTWQLLTTRLGLTLAYRCLSFYAGYMLEVSPLAHTPFVGQKGDVRLQYSW